MIIIKTKDYNELSKKAGMIVLNEILINSRLTIGFATGGTPLGLYQELIKAHKDMNIDFSKIKTFNLDEYYPISKDNKNSYYYFMFENLFNHINVNASQLNLLNGTTKNPKTECDIYEKKIKDNPIDIQILGLGVNGHIGFNEPNSSFDSKTRMVELTQETINDNSRFFKSVEEIPKNALTMGISTIMSAKKILILASGKNKADAVKWLVDGNVDERCPATILQRHPDVVLIIDSEAASLLREEEMPNEMKGYKIITESNIPKNKNIIVISPHPDDASIGPGGTIALLAEKNDVNIFVMTTGHRSFIKDTALKDRVNIREEEVIEESKILKTTPYLLRLEFYDKGKESIDNDVDKVFKKFSAIKPDIVFLPQSKDSHPTHSMAREITIKALEKYNKKVEIWNYESPWALFFHGFFNAIVPLSEKYLQKKINAIKKQKSQVSRTRYDIAAESLSRLRGALIPEQVLFGFGKKSIPISPNLELYYIETMN
jgi:glucosamine-6-phosphate deaminase